MSDRTKVKVIIMDKVATAENATMVANLGCTPGDYTVLATAFNTEFGTNITSNDLTPLQTVGDVCDYVISQIP